MAVPPTGRPDILGLHPLTPSIVVEAKALYLSRQKSFPFSGVRDDQRRWLDSWLDKGGRGYIGLGIIEKVNERDALRDLFLVDWGDWKETESHISKHQRSIPYKPYKGMRKDISEEWCMTQAFDRHRVFKNLPGWHSAVPK
jgi:hypothetical protein